MGRTLEPRRQQPVPGAARPCPALWRLFGTRQHRYGVGGRPSLHGYADARLSTARTPRRRQDGLVRKTSGFGKTDAPGCNGRQNCLLGSGSLFPLRHCRAVKSRCCRFACRIRRQRVRFVGHASTRLRHLHVAVPLLIGEWAMGRIHGYLMKIG